MLHIARREKPEETMGKGRSPEMCQRLMRKTKQGTASKERQMQLRDKQRYVTRKTNMKE